MAEALRPREVTSSGENGKLLQRPRPYQVELFQQALLRNIVAYLDTGSGKTLVSVLLTQEYATELVEISKSDLLHQLSNGDGGQNEQCRDTIGSLTDEDSTMRESTSRNPENMVEVTPGTFLPAQPKKVVFLVPTVPLVAQQAAKIRENTDLIVGEYSRDEIVSVAYWDTIGWYHEMSCRQVLVLTPQIFLNILRHGFLKLDRDVSLLVVDECHHAVKQHPYNVLMKEFYHTISPSSNRPKVFGMTASPIYQRVTTRNESFVRLKELQSNLGCVVVTVADRNTLQNYVPKAREVLVEYMESPRSTSADDGAISGGVDTPTPSMQYYDHWMQHVYSHVKRLESENKADLAEKLKRTIEQINTMKHELGFWLAGKAAEDTLRGAVDPRGRGALASRRQTTNPRQLNETLQEDPSPRLAAPALSAVTQKDVTPKVITLLRLLEERAHAAPEDGEVNFRAMIFVERRLSAKALSDFLNAVAAERFPIIKSSYVTGHGASTSKNSSGRSSMNNSHQKKSFDRFRNGEVNTLVVTRVAEEGVDMYVLDSICCTHQRLPNTLIVCRPACRLVVVFDIFRSHTGYVQSRGRARDFGGSEYLIMVQRNNFQALRTVARAKVAEVMTRSVAEELATHAPEGCDVASASADGGDVTQVYKSEFDNDTTELLLGSSDQPLVTKAGASISAAGSLQVLRRYCAGAEGRSEAYQGYTLEFDHLTGTAEQWRRCLSHHAGSRTQSTTIGAAGISVKPYGYAYSFAFPPWTPLAGEVVHGHIRGTKKLAQQSVALATCRRLYEVGALNEHLLPNRNFKKKSGAFSLAALLARWRSGPKTILDKKSSYPTTVTDMSKEEVLAEYQRDVPKIFQKDGGWESIESLHKTSELNGVISDGGEFYVTVLTFGEELEMYARGRYDDPFDSVLTDISSKDQQLTKTGLPSRRTLALLTRHPVPTLPLFTLWLNGDTPCKVEVENWHPEAQLADSAAGARNEEEAPNPDNDEDEEDESIRETEEPEIISPVRFTFEQIQKLWNFQSKFWDLTLKRTPSQNWFNSVLGKRKRKEETSETPPVEPHSTSPHDEPKQNGGTKDTVKQSEATKPKSVEPGTEGSWTSDAATFGMDYSEPRMYMILPMYGICESANAKATTSGDDDPASKSDWPSGPLRNPRCTWEPEWPMIQKVIDGESCGLYDWIVNFANMVQDSNSVEKEIVDISGVSRSTNSAFNMLYERLRAEVPFDPSNDSQTDVTANYDANVLAKVNELLQQTVAYTPHNRMKYLVHHLVPDMHPSAEFTKQRYRGLITYAEYVRKLGYSVNHPESAMVEAHHSSSVRNLLKPMRQTPEHTSRKPRTANTVHLVPEACRVLPFPRETYRMASVFPSVLHKIDIYCLIDQFRRHIGLPHVQIQTLFAAFSAPSAQEETNYERLETLGDSFLKFAVSVDLFKTFSDSNEGDLSDRRSQIVCNRNLYGRAIELGLASLLNVTPFNPRHWAPPGSKPIRTPKSRNHRTGATDVDDENASPYASQKGPGWRLISQKMLADFVEALIGAYYTDGGNDVAFHLLHKFGLVSEAVVPSGMITNNTDRDVKDSRNDLLNTSGPEGGMKTNNIDLPAPPLGLSQAKGKPSLPPSPIERRLQYRFRNRGLLREALTHSSIDLLNGEMSYQRLEFLGDAVLDWVVTRFFYNSYTSLSPAALTDLRQAAVNNESFARMAAALNLHTHLRHGSASLQEGIDTYIKYLGTLDETAKPIQTALEGPKVLGDLFEAVAGAVFVDSGYDLSVMWMVFKPLMIQFLEIHANPDVVKKSPIRQFHEFFQKAGFAVNDVCYTYDNVDGMYHCELMVLDKRVGYAEANSKPLAKRWATFQGLEWIQTSSAEIASLLQKSRELRER
ncbi:hypothetical protein PhCBS80983_g00942 [Powellomyces hirtus]|uniref:Dicer-like protein 1 n=1 Tax=Powellomyces hirtus TaxID=109895 RepID=A0A507ED74_9FUNG|nr:hypothetical protein PhCBS80983_g00942 [Powellomyces hirtus]